MNVALLQARMGSTRLPGKVLKELHGKPMLLWIIERLRSAQCIDKLVVVTSTNAEDDAIEDFCTRNKILFSRGSDWDVLSRFYHASVEHGAAEHDVIIRMTSDCATHHGSTVDWAYKQFQFYGTDLFSNSNEDPFFLEDGFDVEVVKFHALKTAFLEAKLMSEREHVIPYLKNSKKFTLGFRKMNDSCNFKLSVDTLADFQFVEVLFSKLDPNSFQIQHVVDLLKSEPSILDINKESIINAGYAKSLREDKIVK
ncbi:MAG: spore coat protein [Bacteroidetes bacterium]|nr:spore coat protein [Bacteroidota bacterium]